MGQVDPSQHEGRTGSPLHSTVEAEKDLYFFFNDTATTGIYPLSLHAALPICLGQAEEQPRRVERRVDKAVVVFVHADIEDRKSTRLNSSHPSSSYAVFFL